ncbi:MAG TPA: lipopolysaccharide biosynthesis protein [Candidatus Dormibacteraeota bacterium]|jgi:O-antigen/teichoic acid export membrane protein|nr:lipopolysaccharide biosynthesis protein [Candidatus Dormibacteraeota bacterium]
MRATAVAGGSTGGETGTSGHTLRLVIRSATVAAVAGYLVDLVVIPLVVRHVGATTYGVWATGASILAIAALADVGVRAEVARRVATAFGDGDHQALRRAAHTGTSVLALLAVPLLLVAAFGVPAIRSFVLPAGAPGQSTASIDLFLRVVILAATAGVVLNGHFAVLRGLQRNDVETRSVLVATLAGAGATLGLAFGGAGLWALLGGWAAQTVLQYALQWLGMRRLAPDVRFRLARPDRGALAAFLGMSGLVLLSQVSDVIDSQWDKLVLSHYVGPSSVAAFQLGTMLVLTAKALALLPLTPLLTATAELGRHHAARAQALYVSLERASFAAGSVVLGAAFAFGPAFVRLWLGDDLSAAGHAVRLFSVAVLLNLYAAPLAVRAFGERAHRLPAIGSLVNVVVNGALSIVLTSRIGFDGALYGSIAGNVMGTAIFLVLMRRHMGAQWRWPSLRSIPVGVAVAGALAALHAGEISTWPLLLLAATLYIAVMAPVCARLEGLSPQTLLSVVRR